MRAGIGFNNVDLEAATRAGIQVANVPDYCLDEVADHTMALALSVIRRTCLLDRKVTDGVWDIADAKPMPPCGARFWPVWLWRDWSAGGPPGGAFGMTWLATTPAPGHHLTR